VKDKARSVVEMAASGTEKLPRSRRPCTRNKNHGLGFESSELPSSVDLEVPQEISLVRKGYDWWTRVDTPRVRSVGHDWCLGDRQVGPEIRTEVSRLSQPRGPNSSSFFDTAFFLIRGVVS
jgi:hypothetical protein